MIDETRLADPAACPRCAALPPSSPGCSRCGLPLAGPLAERLWTVSLSAARLLAERAELITPLAASAQHHVDAGAVYAPGRTAAAALAVGQPAPGHPAPGHPAPGHPTLGQTPLGHPAPGHPAPAHPTPSFPAPGSPSRAERKGRDGTASR
jgi:hypothetical protein